MGVSRLYGPLNGENDGLNIEDFGAAYELKILGPLSKYFYDADTRAYQREFFLFAEKLDQLRFPQTSAFLSRKFYGFYSEFFTREKKEKNENPWIFLAKLSLPMRQHIDRICRYNAEFLNLASQKVLRDFEHYQQYNLNLYRYVECFWKIFLYELNHALKPYILSENRQLFTVSHIEKEILHIVHASESHIPGPERKLNFLEEFFYCQKYFIKALDMHPSFKNIPTAKQQEFWSKMSSWFESIIFQKYEHDWSFDRWEKFLHAYYIFFIQALEGLRFSPEIKNMPGTSIFEKTLELFLAKPDMHEVLLKQAFNTLSQKAG